MSARATTIAALLTIGASAQPPDPVWVPGSSQKVCQPTGQFDFETGQPTASQTVTNYGLTGHDLGYSFQHNGKLWFLFGDTNPAGTFNGQPNAQADPPRTPADNDSIGFTAGANLTSCLKLDFVRDSIGAYQNPIVLNAQGQPAITLASFEIPIAGIDIGGRMFVIFATDKNSTFSTRSVMAVSDDDGNSYHYLYDFSAPPCSHCDGAKFVNVAIGSGGDGYLYFWGTGGGTAYRNSPVYLARRLAGGLASSGGMQYFTGLAANGSPNWASTEDKAAGLFEDDDGNPPVAANCAGELGVNYNQYVQRWVMLYNCLNNTPANPNGIRMRFAPQPWGPWGAAQTIFNVARDRGLCHFIHKGVSSTDPACDTVGNPGREDTQGGGYAPYFIDQFTTGNPANGTSTFYYMLSVWNPYIPVIMRSTIQSGPAPVIGLVANAEGEIGTVAPNTWIEIKGLNLGPANARTWGEADFVNNRMPTALDGVSVTVNGKSAYVYYISPTQVNVLTPPDAIGGTVEVVLTYNGASASYQVQAKALSPSFFIFGGGPNVAATHADGTFLGPANLYPGTTTPAKPGEIIVLYANGFGPASVPVVSGSSTQSGVLTPPPVIKIGGIAAQVTYAGLNMPGLFQFNVMVPANVPAGVNTLTATYNGASTQPDVQLRVQP